MTSKNRVRNLRRGSILVYLSFALPFFLMPLAALSIDASLIRVVQAKLQSAVDGASLGAGRLLGTSANLEEIAGEFLNSNFPTGSKGFLGATDLQYTAKYTPGIVKTVRVDASVRVPSILGRLLGAAYHTIPAHATATRKDTRVVMVIDRSGSMSGTIASLKNYAQSFAQKFNGSGTVGGSDQLGLVAYDGSAVVGYPAVRPWDSTITSNSTGGPDSLFKSGASTDMLHQIAAINADSGTGIAEALTLAYVELQKARLRDLAAPNSGGVDQRMNSILLFTDGVPSGISLYLNNPVDNVIRNNSSCDNKAVAAPVPSTKQMRGWVAIPGPPFKTNNFGLVGLYLLASTDPTSSHTASWWMSNNNNTSSAQDVADPNPNTPEKNCTGTYGSSGNTIHGANSDLSRIPTKDMYGNATNTTGYTNSRIVASNGAISSIYNGTALDLAQKTIDYHWGLAIWNSADNAAKNIRADINAPNRAGDSQSMSVTIHVIAYSGNGGVDEGLLKRIANTVDSSSFNQAQETGLYVRADDAAALANAFNQVASSVLHLSQ